MVYCEHQYRRRFAKERTEKDWENKAEDFIDNGSWNYCFKGEATVSDPEQSFLCRYVFAKLMGIETKEIPANKIYIKDDNITYHFDLMNNLKDDQFENKYTIGNFAPIPAEPFPYPKDQTHAHLQLIHNWNNERWDLLLKHLKDNWCLGDLTFNQYMINTCQQLYFANVFEEFYKKYKNKKLDKVNWNKVVSDWNQEIGENDLDAVSFKNPDSQAKIEFLIEARGRCILSILKKQITTPT